MAVSGNTYRNETLGFQITKPEVWTFLPTRWTGALRRRATLDEQEYADALRQAEVPFVSFRFDHGRRDEPFPTVQATCRPLHARAGRDREGQLRALLDRLGRTLPDLRVDEAIARGIVASRRANIVKAAFTVRSRDGRTFPCRTRAYAIVDRTLVFTIGLTGPADGRFRCDAEFEQITASIRVF